MCQYNREENKLLGKVGEECSIKRIYGTKHKCKAVETCIAAETALASQVDPMSTKIIFSNVGPINDKCFLPFVLYTELPQPSL